MCAEIKPNKQINQNILFLLAAFLGVCGGYFDIPWLFSSAEAVSQIFINLLKLVSLPIIFFSIISTASGMESLHEIKKLGSRVIKYTLSTTLIAASVALLLFIAVNPVRSIIHVPQESIELLSQPSYFSYFIKIIPSNIIQPFSENNVIGVLVIAMLLSFAILSLPNQHRVVLHSFFSSFYAAIMVVTRWIVFLMPIAIWAFITLFMRDYRQGLDAASLLLYLTCVVAANLIQAMIVLPAFLKAKNLSPIKVAKGMFPALSVAFFTKSSSAALPMAMKCAEENLGISRKTASFSLPLCTTINMNACAAFILTTVLFVSMSNGMTFSYPEMIVWVFMATIAAVGNAGVPMGCYFLSGAFLAAMNVPLNIMGVILPFYTLIDMLESAINVWSDSCVAAMVHQDMEFSKSSSVCRSHSEPAETSLSITN